MIYSALNMSHILQNYQLPAYSVFIRDCLYTHHVNGVTRIIKAEIRFSRKLHGGDTVSTRITPDEAISPDQHGRPRMF